MSFFSQYSQSIERLELEISEGRYQTLKATLYFLLIPLMIISLMKSFYHPLYLTIICLLIGFKDIKGYVVHTRFKFGQIIQISYYLLLSSALTSFICIKIMSYFGMDDPQGIRDSVLSNEEYYGSLMRLPFIAIGEEFFKLLIFISFIILLSQYSKHLKIVTAILLVSFIFGHLHIIGYELTAGLPLMIGAIPGFIFMIYYRSILPLILEHLIFDFLSFTMHSQFQFVAYIFIIALILHSIIMGTIRGNSLEFGKD